MLLELIIFLLLEMQYQLQMHSTSPVPLISVRSNIVSMFRRFMDIKKYSVEQLKQSHADNRDINQVSIVQLDMLLQKIRMMSLSTTLDELSP